MRTALDTNVISGIWSAEPSVKAISATLSIGSAEGPLIISAPVYAELLGYPNATVHFLERFMSKGGIGVDFNLDEEIWRETGVRFSQYATRRRRSKGGHPPRLLTDFIIGAHALHRADRLLTLDVTRYRRDFPELRLITIP